MAVLNLISRLRYQVVTPQVTTFGPCPQCGVGSRGSNVCSACLMAELTQAVGAAKADKLYFALCSLRDAVWALDDAIEGAES